MTTPRAIPSVVPAARRSGPRAAARIALAAAFLIAAVQTAGAQAVPDTRTGLEFMVSSGRLIPTGAQRDVLKSGNMTAAQLWYVVSPSLAITTSFGWTRSRDIASVGEPKLDVFGYDLGVEARAKRWRGGKAVTFSPFLGVGAGGRSYNYRSLDVDARHNLAAYGSVGGELGYWRARLRVEVRDYVTGFKPLNGAGESVRRNDVALMVGLRLVGR